MDVMLECRVCLQEIPPDHNSEKDEYVSNFCGLACYQLWQQQSDTPNLLAEPLAQH